MKRQTLLIYLGIIVICLAVIFFYKPTRMPAPISGPIEIESEASDGSRENPSSRIEYEFLKLRNPRTAEVPRNISTRELAFIKKSMLAKGAQGRQVSSDWLARGPYNIGGRTKALAIDVKDEKTIIAGCVSSGMWKSRDSGQSWQKTTAPDQLHSVSSIAQNKYPGMENIWYYGTGEYHSGTGGSAAGPAGTTGYYRGDGIFKSLDNGSTWSLLPATVSETPEATDAFDFIYKLITFAENGILAATSSGVFRSSDGGTSWKHVLDFGGEYPSSDIAGTSTGTFYATIDGKGPATGFYKSTDGETWENISPPNWPDTTTRTIIAIPPSNENVVYLVTEVAHWKQTFKKYEAGVGWTDLTKGLPHNAEMTTYGANMMILYVKPDDENVLFLGTVGMYRSKDAGQSFEVIGAFDDFHVDQHAIAFLTSNPKTMIVGNDGGLFRTYDNTAGSVYYPDTGERHIAWESLNNGYLTTQFYTVAVDHGTPNSKLVLGGTQDNAWQYTDSVNPLQPWTAIFGGAFDGGFCAISNGGKNFYISAGGTFLFYRIELANVAQPWTEITPASAIGMGLWMNPLLLDTHDSKVLYVPSRKELWRNSDLTSIPQIFPSGPTNVNWTKLENVHPPLEHLRAGDVRVRAQKAVLRLR